MRRMRRRYHLLLFSSVLVSVSAPGRLAAREECNGDELAGLAAGHAIAGQETGQARGAGWATAVATDHAVQIDSLDVEPEWVGVGHIGERLLGRRDRIAVAASIGDELGRLAPRHAVAG